MTIEPPIPKSSKEPGMEAFRNPGIAPDEAFALDRATAFAHRDAPVMLLIITPYEDPATESEHVSWTLALHDSLAANDAGVYSNFLESEGDARVRETYPRGTYERLAEIKRRYDASSLFRLNQNIRPSVAVR